MWTLGIVRAQLFYRPNDIPVCQLTVSEHQSTEWLNVEAELDWRCSMGCAINSSLGCHSKYIIYRGGRGRIAVFVEVGACAMAQTARWPVQVCMEVCDE